MAKRRNSVEWAQWTHEQNQEMLHAMKMEAYASTPPREAMNETSDGINHERISKMMSRKNRTPVANAPTTSLPRHGEDIPHRLAAEESPVVAPHESRGHEETSYLEAEIAHLRGERDLLLEDQAKLMSIIQADNAKMMEVLNVRIQ